MLSNGNPITVGADPEVFVRRNGQYISGHTFPCGSKERPRMLKNGAVQCDGMALEFNVKPAKTKVEFTNNVVKIFKDLQNIVAKEDPSVELMVIPTAVFGKAYIDSMPEQVKELGCNPDFNCYTMEPNPVPDGSGPFRTGAGHVHVGFTEDMDPSDFGHMLDCSKLTRQLDYYLGLPSLNWDSDSDRRSLYGAAGAFRPKSYGMEYRVLSNAWVANKALMEFVYDRTMMAHAALEAGNEADDAFPGLARTIINGNERDWASKYPEIAHFDYAA